jgi:hypothetical protein
MKMRRGKKLAWRQIPVTEMRKGNPYGEVEGARQAIDGLHGLDYMVSTPLTGGREFY